MISLSSLRNKPFIIYGAGGGYNSFRSTVLDRFHLQPICILDRVKDGRTIDGQRVIHPAGYNGHFSIPVVITLGDIEAQNEVRETLAALGFTTIVLATDIYEYHLHTIPEGFDSVYMDRHANEIKQAREMLEDGKSREIFDAMIRFHRTREMLTITSNPAEEQYRPKDVVFKKTTTRTIHCGAYHGETIPLLVKLAGHMDVVACFEPDPDNFKILQEQLLGTKYADNTMLFPHGVSDKEETLKFSKYGPSSTVTENGTESITVKTIDGLLPYFEPTFITMDIEGMELKALKGASKVIIQSLPELAICIYHSPADMWEILLWLKQFHAYRFYIRNHTGTPSDTVLYAIGGVNEAR